MSKRENKKYAPEFLIKVAKAYISGKYGGYVLTAREFGVEKKRPYEWASKLKKYWKHFFIKNKLSKIKKHLLHQMTIMQ